MKKLSVLIIEDDEMAAEILQRYIQIHCPEARLKWCWDGFEALKDISEFKPDLIFLDYMMPKLDGEQFIHALRALESSSNAYVVVVSAFVNQEKEEQFYALGINECLSKPIYIEKVAAILDKLL